MFGTQILTTETTGTVEQDQWAVDVIHVIDHARYGLSVIVVASLAKWCVAVGPN